VKEERGREVSATLRISKRENGRLAFGEDSQKQKEEVARFPNPFWRGGRDFVFLKNINTGSILV